MKVRIGVYVVVGLLLVAVQAAAQTQPRPDLVPLPGRYPVAGQPPAPGPDQPVVPRDPRLQPRTPAPQPPFVLTAEQQAQVDQVLKIWEQRNEAIKDFACKFTRWEYDAVWGSADQAKYQETGVIKYGQPDKGRFQIDGQRPELWICNGKSIFEHNHQAKLLTEYQLPPELQGEAITNGPLPFLFGAKADQLKRRYYLRLVTPPNVQGQVWLEAYPRYQADAANFQRSQLILNARDMLPHALQVYVPNGKTRTAYLFEKIVVNDPLSFIKGNPFKAPTPSGWRRVVEPPPTTAQTNPPPTTNMK